MSQIHSTRSTTDALGLSTVNGLPAHILIVHAVVIFVPLSAIALIAAIRPTWARRLGLALPVLSVAALVSVIAAMNAGGWLQNHVQNTALVRDHTRIAGQLWPFSAVVALLSVVVWWLSTHSTTSAAGPRRSRRRTSTVAIIAVLSIVVGIGSIVEVVRIGDTGARAAWHNHFTAAK